MKPLAQTLGMEVVPGGAVFAGCASPCLLAKQYLLARPSFAVLERLRD